MNCEQLLKEVSKEQIAQIKGKSHDERDDREKEIYRAAIMQETD